ncbi:MAG: glycosyl hydrolase [Armatimonadota bacterium]
MCGCAAILLICFVLMTLSSSRCYSSPQIDTLAHGFTNPPDEAKPRVFWYWLRNWASKEGLTKDLEEYKAKCIGGVMIVAYIDAAGPMPSGPNFMSPAWRELFKHAVKECHRLKLEMSVNLCYGWDMGGPWITPEYNSRVLAQSRLVLSGPRMFSGQLPAPPGISEHYKDITIQAIRLTEDYVDSSVTVTGSSSQPTWPASNVADGNDARFWVSSGASPAERPRPERPEWLLFEYAKPIVAPALRIWPRAGFGPKDMQVQVSDDGKNFKTVKIISLDDEPDITIPLGGISSKSFRLLITSSYSPWNVQVVKAEFLTKESASLQRAKELLGYKTNFSSYGKPEEASIHDITKASLSAPSDVFAAHSVKPGEVIDLSTRMNPDGSLNWSVPAGNWVVIRTGYAISNHRVADGGLHVDFLSREALDIHYKATAKVLIQDAGVYARNTLKYFFEDSWESRSLSWTPGFEDYFKKFAGYDIKPYLPVIAGYTIGSPEISDRFLYDYRQALADCFTINHYKHFQELAHTDGIGLHCESGGPCYPTAPSMDALRNLSFSDIPMGEFWQSRSWKEGIYNKVGKQTSSAAHLYGSKYVAAESFTALDGDLHWKVSLANLKPTADLALCDGFNRFFIHTSNTVRDEDGKPGYEFAAGTHFNRNVTWWNQSGAFLKYVARCQYLLSQGLFVGDVCYFNDDNVPNLVEPKHIIPTLGRGYDYDVCNTDALLHRMSVRNGRIVLPDGMSYRLLVLPESSTMPVAVIKKLRQLIEAGATVIGPKPATAPGLINYPASQNAVRSEADLIWGHQDTQKPGDHRLGKGMVIWGESERTVLLSMGVPPDFQYSTTAKEMPLEYIHRLDGNTHIYFVVNTKPTSVQAVCRFRVTGKQPEIWDAVTGEMKNASSYTQSNGYTSLPLAFAPHGSVFIIFKHNIPVNSKGLGINNSPVLDKKLDVTGSWNVRFDPKWGGPATTVFEQLQDWSKSTIDGIKYYSGTAIYSKTITLPASLLSDHKQLYLDLGKVMVIGTVKMNGKPVGCTWTEPYRVAISHALRAGKNTIEVEVANLWPNRLIGDAGLPQDKRYTHSNVSYDKSAPLLSSGLLGPVAIYGSDH